MEKYFAFRGIISFFFLFLRFCVLSTGRNTASPSTTDRRPSRAQRPLLFRVNTARSTREKVFFSPERRPFSVQVYYRAGENFSGFFLPLASVIITDRRRRRRRYYRFSRRVYNVIDTTLFLKTTHNIQNVSIMFCRLFATKKRVC